VFAGLYLFLFLALLSFVISSSQHFLPEGILLIIPAVLGFLLYKKCALPYLESIEEGGNLTRKEVWEQSPYKEIGLVLFTLLMLTAILVSGTIATSKQGGLIQVAHENFNLLLELLRR